MECNVPTDIVFSFSGLASRGGKSGPHADGWGLALYEGKRARVFLETEAAWRSPLAEYVRKNPIKTLLAVAHVRKRTRGRVTLANTHPFVRELWGRNFVFAHNGTVRGGRKLKTGIFRAVGETDSEHAFLSLLAGLRHEFLDYPKSRREYHAAVKRHADRIGAHGSFNFLLADGSQLFARCGTKLHYIIRKAPFRRATLADEDVRVDFAAVTTPNDRVAVVATLPLTRDEVWTSGAPGELWVFRKGALVAELKSG